MTVDLNELKEFGESNEYESLISNGQRVYGPPIDWVGPPPPKGCEIFIGNLPRNFYEKDIVPIFETIGKIYKLRLMITFSSANRGFAFLTYTNPQDADNAIKVFNDYPVRPGKHIGVVKSRENNRLFLSNIPRDMTEEDIKEEIAVYALNVVSIHVPMERNNTQNKGYALIEFREHKDAALARRCFIPAKLKLHGVLVRVDWAKIDNTRIFIRGILAKATESKLTDAFSIEGQLEISDLKRQGNCAYVNYKTRKDAERAMAYLKGFNDPNLVCGKLLIKWADSTNNTNNNNNINNNNSNNNSNNNKKQSRKKTWNSVNKSSKNGLEHKRNVEQIAAMNRSLLPMLTMGPIERQYKLFDTNMSPWTLFCHYYNYHFNRLITK